MTGADGNGKTVDQGPDWPDPASTEEVDVQQVARQLGEGAAIANRAWRLVDCREDDEFAYNRIAGAEHLALSRWGEFAPRLLEQCRDQVVVVYCHHGIRSLNATRWLRAKGCAASFSLAGGIDRWSSEVDPDVPRY